MNKKSSPLRTENDTQESGRIEPAFSPLTYAPLHSTLALVSENQARLEVIEGGAKENATVSGSYRQSIGDFIVPRGFEVWGDGTYRVEELPDDEEEARQEPSLHSTPSKKRKRGLRIVARRPIWIRQFAKALDSEDELVQLAFYDAFGSPGAKFEWVTRSQISDRRQLVALAARGMPIRTGNADRVEDYIDRALHENAPTLPRVLMAARSGAYHVAFEEQGPDKHWGWLIGKTWVGEPGTCIERDPRQEESATKGYVICGAEDAWFRKFKEICSVGPVPRWLSFATFAAPLLRFLRHRTFIIHHWGDSGSGKTALMKLAMSAWGDPHALTATFNRTEKSFTEMFSYVDDLPIAFDELQASKNDDHASIIYALCLERGRARAKKSGGLHKEISSWRSVVRMTGEEPIIGNGKIDLGGQSNRVLQLNAPALVPAQAERIHQWLEGRHFGWGGLRFVERLQQLMNDESAEELLQSRHRMIRDEINRHVPGLRSRSSALAAVALAQVLGSQWFFGAPKDAALHGAIQDAIHVAGLIAADEEDYATVTERTLQVFRDHREANRSKWFDVSTPEGKSMVSQQMYRELFAIERAGPNADEIWIVQGAANALLRKEGLPPGRVWVDFKRSGVLRTGQRKDGRGRLDAVRKLGQFRNRVYVIANSVFNGED